MTTPLGTSILKNVTINYCKIDPENPAEPFGTLQWEVQALVPEDRLSEIEDLGRIRAHSDYDLIPEGFLAVNLRRKAFTRDGKPNFPVEFVDINKKPITNYRNIGNGSTANVKIYRREYDVAGRQGISTILSGIQMITLVEYNGSVDFDIESQDTDEAF